MKTPRILPIALAMAVAAGSVWGAEPFSIVIVPDTQNYAEKFPDTYLAQTRWIRDNIQKENVRFVIHLGDIVQNHNESEAEWQVADRAHQFLDGEVAYSMLPGNHDLEYKNKVYSRETTLYNKHFGPQRFAGQPWYGGHWGETNDNNYCRFEAGGMKFLVVSLEYAPRDEVLAWAAEVAAAHADHRVIMATHCYMRPTGRDDQCGGTIGNSGNGTWEKFVRPSPNVFLVVSGHVLGVGRQVSTNDAGRPVHETLVDYQGLPNGGNGWLRIMRFVPDQNRIEVRAYSPLLGKTMDDDGHTFQLPYEMTPQTRLQKAG
ncbi:MAG: metallophosphoesterase [Thermoguttaceae bacterium]